MKIEELHKENKAVSAIAFFKGEVGTATAIHLMENAVFKEHITKTPALLLCVQGSVLYEDETTNQKMLLPGSYINIIPNVKHWLVAKSNSQLVLLK